MDNASRKIINSLFYSLNHYYISPLSKLYLDIEALRSFVSDQQSFPKTSDPLTWFLPQKRDNILSTDQIISRLTTISSYLKNQRNVFDRSFMLELNSSFPYFEWVSNQEAHAITDYLDGMQFLLFDDDEFDTDSLDDVIFQIKRWVPSATILFFTEDETLIEGRKNEISFVISGSISISIMNKLNGIKQNKLFISRFHQRVRLALLNKQGKLVEILTKSELNRKIETLLRTYSS